MSLAPSISVTLDTVEIIEVAAQGAAGVAGQGGTVSLAASAALSGHRVIAYTSTGEAKHADNLTAADAWAIVGISAGAAALGDPVTVQTAGVMTEPSWTWSPLGLLYCGAAGVLTQTPPIAPAFVRVVGFATSPTSIYVDPQTPIVQV